MEFAGVAKGDIALWRLLLQPLMNHALFRVENAETHLAGWSMQAIDSLICPTIVGEKARLSA